MQYIMTNVGYAKNIQPQYQQSCITLDTVIEYHTVVMNSLKYFLFKSDMDEILPKLCIIKITHLHFLNNTLFKLYIYSLFTAQ